YDLLASIEILANACTVFARKCVVGITANRDRCRSYAERSAALVTVLAPVIGYDATAKIFKESFTRDGPILQAIIGACIAPCQVDALLDLTKLTRGGRA